MYVKLLEQQLRNVIRVLLSEIDVGEVGDICYSPQATTHILQTCTIGGNKYYLKYSQDELASSNNPALQILVEYLAYRIYSLYPNISIPNIELVFDAKNKNVGLATSAIEGKIPTYLAPEKLASMLSAGILVDIFIANWDLIKKRRDNIIHQGEKATRIDPGGALTFRARGEKKGEKFGPNVGELQTMLDPKLPAGSVLSLGDMKKAAREFTLVDWGSIASEMNDANAYIMKNLKERDMNELLSEWTTEYNHIVSVLNKRHGIVLQHAHHVLSGK